MPVGLGMLIFSNHLSDMRALYCATGSEMDANAPFVGTAAKYRFIAGDAAGNCFRRMYTSIRHVKDLGGSGGRDTLMFSDWSKIPTAAPDWGNGSPSFAGYSKGIGCSYAYRNQPTFLWDNANTGRPTVRTRWDNGDYSFTGADASGAGGTAGHFPDTVNYAYENPTCARKTARLLGGRAVAMDRFGAPGEGMNYVATIYPGDGILAHRDGYNVLYGDGSTRWIGDPQQKYIWTDQRASLWGAYMAIGGMASNVQVSAFAGTPPGFSTPYTFASNGIRWWLLFDQAAGIGVGTQMYPGMACAGTTWR
ncbi:MAG TPA: hypothetical protein P5137_05465 [Candidatus Brocadiia bacterium]|nr:hypothetical protein [Candidatus Brocadiia bacterium]